MTLDQEDIEAIADAVFARIHRAESIRRDAEFEVSLGFEEMKRRGHQKLMESRQRKVKK
jgi:hypothetical protein